MRIGVDVDGVLADYAGEYLRVVARVTGRKYSYDQLNRSLDEVLNLKTEHQLAVNAVVHAPGWAVHLPLLPGAARGIDVLCRRHKLVFVTSPLKASPTWASDRYQWINRHFQGIPVISTSDKDWVDADLLIDDAPGNAQRWASRRHRAALLFDQPWNRDAAGFPLVHRVKSWDEIIQWVDW